LGGRGEGGRGGGGVRGGGREGRGEREIVGGKRMQTLQSMLQVHKRFCIVIGAFTTYCNASGNIPDFFWLLYGVACGHS